MAVTRLEEIVTLLETAEIDLDESVKLYKEGMTLAIFCEEKLTSAEGEILLLKKTQTGLFRKETYTQDE